MVSVVSAPTPPPHKGTRLEHFCKLKEEAVGWKKLKNQMRGGLMESRLDGGGI